MVLMSLTNKSCLEIAIQAAKLLYIVNEQLCTFEHRGDTISILAVKKSTWAFAKMVARDMGSTGGPTVDETGIRLTLVRALPVGLY